MCSAMSTSGVARRIPTDRNVRKRDLAIRVAEAVDLPQTKVLEVIQKTFDAIVEELAAGRTIELRKFGVFEVVERKGRMGRNPQKPEQLVEIPAHKVVRFRPGKEMRETLP